MATISKNNGEAFRRPPAPKVCAGCGRRVYLGSWFQRQIRRGWCPDNAATVLWRHPDGTGACPDPEEGQQGE